MAGSHSNGKFSVLKVDKNGEIVFYTVYDSGITDPSSCNAESTKELSDGNYLAAGRCKNEIFIMKLNTSGGVIKALQIDEIQSHTNLPCTAYDFVETSDGIIFTGVYKGTSGDREQYICKLSKNLESIIWWINPKSRYGLKILKSTSNDEEIYFSVGYNSNFDATFIVADKNGFVCAEASNSCDKVTFVVISSPLISSEKIVSIDATSDFEIRFWNRSVYNAQLEFNEHCTNEEDDDDDDNDDNSPLSSIHAGTVVMIVLFSIAGILVIVVIIVIVIVSIVLLYKKYFKKLGNDKFFNNNPSNEIKVNNNWEEKEKEPNIELMFEEEDQKKQNTKYSSNSKINASAPGKDPQKMNEFERLQNNIVY